MMELDQLFNLERPTGKWDLELAYKSPVWRENRYARVYLLGGVQLQVEVLEPPLDDNGTIRFNGQVVAVESLRETFDCRVPFPVEGVYNKGPGIGYIACGKELAKLIHGEREQEKIAA